MTFKSRTHQGRRVYSHPPDGVDIIMSGRIPCTHYANKMNLNLNLNLNSAANVFSFEALFANNPFWCLNQKHVSKSRLGKTQPDDIRKIMLYLAS